MATTKSSPWNNMVQEEKKKTVQVTRNTPWNNAVETGNPEVKVNNRKAPSLPEKKGGDIVSGLGAAIGTGISQTLSGVSNILKSAPVAAEAGAKAISNLADAPVKTMQSRLNPSEIKPQEEDLTKRFANALFGTETPTTTVEQPKTEQGILKNKLQNIANNQSIAQGNEPVKQITEWSDPWDKALANNVENVQSAGQAYTQAVTPVTNWVDKASQTVNDYTEREFMANLNPTEQYVAQAVGNAIPNFTRQALLGAVSGGSLPLLSVLSDVAMFLPSFYQGYEEGKQNGLSDEEAYLNAIVRGGIEAGSEHLSDVWMVNGGQSVFDEYLLNKIASSNMTPFAKFVGKQMLSGLGEATEEVAARLGNTVADRGIYGTDIDYGQLALGSLEDAGASFISTMVLGLLGGQYSSRAYNQFQDYANSLNQDIENDENKTYAALILASMDDAQRDKYLAQAQEAIRNKYGADDPIANMGEQEFKDWVERNVEKQIMGLSEEQYARYIDDMNGTEMPVGTIRDGKNTVDVYEYYGNKTADQVKALEIADRFGVKAYIVDELPAGQNAQKADDGTIYISSKAKKPASTLIWHEIFHLFRNNGTWNDLKEIAFNSMAGDVGFNNYMDNLLARYVRYYGNIDNSELQRISLSTDLSAEEKNQAKREYLREQGVNQYYADESFRNKIDEEVAAEFMERFDNEDTIRAMFNRSGNTAEQIWQKLHDAVRGFTGTLTQEEQDLVNAEQLYAKVARENYDKARADVKVADDGSVYAMYSAYTWNALGDEGKKQLARDIADQLGMSEDEVGKVEQWLESINTVSAMIGNDKARLDYTPNKAYSALKKDSDYVYTVDMSTLCKKRILLSNTIEEIQRLLPDLVLTGDDYIRIRQMMKDKNYEVACGFCYVESRRKFLDTVAQQFIDVMTGQKPEKAPNNRQVMLTDELRNKDDYIPDLYELTTATGIEQLRSQHPEVYNTFVSFNNARGQNRVKLIETRTEYNREILDISDTDFDTIQKHGGLRLQSYSDFETPHLIDMMQVVADMAARGFKSQAYTKVPNFADAFGRTGIKINESLVVLGVDENGNLIYDDVEGMPHEIAFALRQKYPDTVGTVIVGKDDATILAAMADPKIDYIIPFHASGWKQSEYEALGIKGYQNYTNYQTEKDVVSNKTLDEQLYPSDYWDDNASGDENAQNYLRLCEAQGRIPKFSNFLTKDNEGHWVAPSGYWKTLIDFKMYDNDGNNASQRVVTPTFDDTVNQRILDEYEGDHNKFSPKMDIVNEFIKEKGYGTRYSLSEDDMKMLGIRPDSYWDDQYMDAVNRGDMEEAQRLRNLHAADAGYDPNTWYHGTGEYFNEFNLGGEGIHLGNNEQARQIARERFNKRSMTTMYEWDRIRDDLENLADTNIDLLYNVAQELIDVNYELLENPIEDEFDENIIYDENIPIEDVIDQLREYGDKISDEFLKEVNYDHDISVRIPTYDREVGEHVMRLYTDNANPFYVNGDIESWTPERIAEMLLRRNEGEDRMLTHPYGDVFADITGSDISLDADEQEILWDILNGDVKGDEAWEDINALLLSNGYTGIEYLNKYEGDRNSPSRLVMNPTGVKSADAVTYDNNGNVIPLSQRDNPLNPDIRYSLNDMGEPLSEGQQEYFRNSVVRNADGNLKVMYHGSDIEFNEFDKNKIRSVDYDAPFNGFWFSSDPNTSPAMHDAKVTRAFYLNITNPAPSDVYERVDREIDESYTRAIRAAFGEDGTQGLYDDDANDRLQRELINEGWHEGSRSMNDELRYRLQDMGYDGIHWDGVPDINWEELSTNGITNFRTLQGRNRQLEKFSHGDVFNDLAERYPDAFTLNYGNGEYIVDYGNREDFERLQEEVWVAFEPNQIKRTDNLNPSEDNDIRYSLDEEQTLERRPYQTNGVTGEDLRPYIKGLLNEDGQVALTAENHDSFEKSIKRQIRKLVDNAVWNIEDANNAKLTINKSKTVNALYEALIEKRCDIHDIENSFARNNINIYGEREINGVNRRSSANNTFLEVLLGYMGFDGIQNPESGKTLSRDENGQRQIIEDSMNLNAETPQQRDETVQRLAEAMQTEPVVEDIPEQANRYKAKDNPQGRAANIFLGKLSRERNAADPYTYESISPESFPVPDRIQEYMDLIQDEDDRKYGFDTPEENELTDDEKQMYQSFQGNKSGALQGFATPTQMANNMLGKEGEQRQFFRDRFELPMYEQKKLYNAAREERWNALENMIKETGIQANTQESAAVQWYGEGVKPNEQGETVPYTLDDLKREFPSKWEDIVKMERFMRNMYDEYVGRINEALEQVYPNLEEKAQAQLQSWRNKKQIYQDEISMSRNPGANEYWENEIRKLDKKIAKLEGDLESGEYFRNKRLNHRKDYFHHFQEVETKGIGGLKNILQASTLIDPELVGKSEFTKPKSKWMSWLQKRGEGAYTADAVLGMAKYIDSAEYAIAFDPLIAQYRDEISKMVRATKETKNANQLIQYLSGYTNQLAGKTPSLDRTILDLLGEGNRGQLFNALAAINNRAKSNAVVGNVRSAVSQIFNIPNAMSIIKSNSAWSKGASDYLNAKLGNRELLDQSPFLQERYFDHNVDDLKARNTQWDKIVGKVGDFTNKMMEFGDREATELIWLAAYNEGLEKNVADPIYYADDMTRQSVAGRGIGEVPYNMKSKVASFFMPFQVETNNAWQNLKGMLKDKDATGVFRLMLASFLMNAMVKPLFNDGVVPDVLGALVDGIGKMFDKDREESIGEVALDTGKRMAGEAISYIPGTSLWLPAIMSDESAEALFGDSDPTRYGTGTVGLSTITNTMADAVNGGGFDLMTPLLQMTPSFGGRQASRLYNTLQDLNVIPSNGFMNTPFGGERNPVAGDYSKAGALKYRLPDEVNSASDVAEIARALAFGSNATNAAREYYDNGNKPLLSKERVQKLREHPEVDPDTYISYLKEANKDGSTGISQQEAYDWISSHNLSNEEANALWEMTSNSWKKSYDEYQPKEEKDGEQNTEPSGNPTTKKELTKAADENGNGNLSQAEAYAWLNSQDLTDEEKALIWELGGWKTDYETYASKH